MAIISRGFSGRRSGTDAKLPPAQYLTTDFPVLSAGPTPRISLDRWEFTIDDGSNIWKRCDWKSFRALPTENITVDIHCVTRWSKLGTSWEGVSLDVLLADVKTDLPYAMFRSYGDYTTNLHLRDVMNKQAWIAFRANAMTLLTTVLLTVATGFGQSSGRLPVTDAEKIAEALRAGPAFITKDATVIDWPSAPGGEYRVLRRGSYEWTCLPAIPGYPHDAFDSAFKREPGCYDPVFLRWMQDSLAGRRPHIDRIGMSYMYFGLWKPAKDGHEFHVGPHLMVVGPNPDEFQGFNRDATNGMPYVTHLPNRPELFLVMPVRQWNE